MKQLVGSHNELLQEVGLEFTLAGCEAIPQSQVALDLIMKCAFFLTLDFEKPFSMAITPEERVRSVILWSDYFSCDFFFPPQNLTGLPGSQFFETTA